MNHRGYSYGKLKSIFEHVQVKAEKNKLSLYATGVARRQNQFYNFITMIPVWKRRLPKHLKPMKAIKYFIFPVRFKVRPIGDYNPDWAILKQNGEIVYMIRETKSTKEKLKLRLPETDKILCGHRHFEAIGVDYDLATSVEDAKL